MEAEIAPQPPEAERRALLEALVDEGEPYASAWREAALREGTESEEP